MATPVALPQTLGDTSTAINALFSAQNRVNVKLERIRFDPGGTPLDFTTFLVNTPAGADGRLWEADYTIDDGTLDQQAEPFGPLNAASYQTYDVSVDEGVPTYGGNPGALSFRWTAVPIPGTSDTVDVDLTAILASTSEVVIKWRIKITRNSGASASIDKITAPIVWLRGPASTDATFPDHVDAQKRTRVLCPTFDAASAPVFSRNIDFWSLSNFSATYEAGHPGISHTYQFFAIVSANNTPDAAYLKAFYYGTADGGGYQKAFGFRGRRVGTDGYMQFYCKHIPPFTDLGGNKTAFGNEWETPYYAETGVIDCADDHFWFDVCKFYRGRLDAVGGLPPLLETSTVLSSRFMGNAVWFGNAQTQLAKFRNENLAAVSLGVARFFRKFLETNNRAKPDIYMHFQQWLNQALGSVANPSNSPNGDYRFVDDDPFLPERGLREMFAVAAGESIFSSGYTIPQSHHIIAKGYDHLLDDMPLLNRKGLSSGLSGGSVGPSGELISPVIRLDLGLQRTRDWIKENTIAFSSGWGMISLYLDTLGGTGQFTTYPSLDSSHVQNGGNHGAVTKKQIIEDCRALLKANPAHQVDPNIPIVFTEATEDGMLDVLDFASVSYYFIPNMLGPDADDVSRGSFVGAIPNVSEVARNQSPDIYAAIFHDRFRTLFLMPSMTTILLASNTDWNPSNSLPGLSAAEFTAWHAYIHACSFISGLIDNVNMIYEFYVDRTDLTEEGESDVMWNVGAKNRDDTLKDPLNKGMVIMNFKRDLSEAQAVRGYGGQFLNFGEFQRPLLVDDGVSTQQLNPLERHVLFDMAGDTPERDAGVRVIGVLPGFYAPDGSYQYAFNAWSNYAVLHSMWSSPPAPAPAPNDRVGLVLVNWTESSAEWRATMDSSHYPGLGGTFTAKRLDAAGGEVTLASGLSGTITIGTVGGEDVSLGANIPPLSLQVIVFDP